MNLRISGIVNDSIVDGPGIRYVIFTQGCPHHCEGCHNPQTHDFHGGYLLDTSEILTQIKDNPLLDGVTFSGGEPFCQSRELVDLAKSIHSLGLDIYAYTGYTYEYLCSNQEYYELLKEIDYLVDGPFIISKRDTSLKFKGSSNQRIINVQESIKSNKIILVKI